ncbi:sce7725 family protein [Paenibacillus vandeheii]
MYFPYLRAKQFELIALRELAENNLIGKYVLPVIEPVRLSSTLIRLIELYSGEGRNIGVVQNPKVGVFNIEFNEESDDNLSLAYRESIKSPFVLNSYVTDQNTKIWLSKLESEGANNKEFILIHDSREYLSDYNKDISSSYPKYNLVPDESEYRRAIKENRILFRDKFVKKTKNSAYSETVDEFFSNDHLFYGSENYIGFADYSVIGSEYNDAGFAPYAVAIHIVYFDSESNLRVKHFVSDSNKDTKDPAGKFGQALVKLVECPELDNVNTFGLTQFRKHYQDGTYPGLGTVKKLSVMHHLELVSRYLDEVRQ